MKRAWLALALAACGSFEDEDIVVDTRVLAMAATVPDQVIDVALEKPQSDLELLEQLVPTRMCALVADPSKARDRLGWTPTVTFEQLVARMVEADLARYRKLGHSPVRGSSR